MSDDSIIKLQCSCGETYFAAEQHLGKYINCPCGRVLSISRPMPTVKYNSAPTANYNPNFRAEHGAARKSFSARSVVSIVIGVLCLFVGLRVLVGYFQPRQNLNNKSAGVSSASPYPAATIEPTLSPSYTYNYNRNVEFPPGFLASQNKPVSLKNGAAIAPPQGPRGKRFLKLINDFDSDVAVKLVENTTGKTRRFFYVRANSRTTVSSIAGEDCRLFFSTGEDWDAENRKFLRNAIYNEFELTLNFRRTNYSISLKPSINGTVPVEPIDEEKFADK